jgi:hypothetical protein
MNIPKTKLDDAKNILVVGLGSGFDVFTSLPLVFHWKDKNFVLVNSGTSSVFHFQPSTQLEYPEGLISDTPNIKAKYTIGRHGYKPFKIAYEKIANLHQIDCVLAIDGGVDSLAIGDELDSGTILEDFVSLAALSDLNVPKILCCAGFGGETEENLNHFRILENMARLATNGAFLGSFSLTKDMPEFEAYKKECEKVWEDRRKSHIQTKIISAVLGKFGPDNHYENIDPRLAVSTGISFISLLSSIYWMFDFDAVVKQNKAINCLKNSTTFVDAKIILKDFLKAQALRSHEKLPL